MKSIKIQLPVNIETKRKGELLAEEWGLSSFNDLLRFLAENAIKGNIQVNISAVKEPKIEYLTEKQLSRLKKLEREFEEAEKKEEVFIANTAEELFKHLNED
jgi:hypothetical protein